MTHSYKDGKIIVDAKYHEKVPYEISNELIGVTADGLGGLASYRIANKSEDCIRTFFSLSLALDGVPFDPYCDKRVSMIGRTETVTLSEGERTLSIRLFLAKEVNGVFYEITAAKGEEISLVLNCRSAKCDDRLGTTFVQGMNFALSCDKAGDWLRENDAFYVSGKGSIRFLFTFGGDTEAHKEAFYLYSKHDRETRAKTEGIRIPASAVTEEERALYTAAYFTSLENHKSVGDFRAFAAGCAYLDPLRTYFRDSYFTMLPCYEDHPAYVREEIITLAKGIAEDGSCPSAVKSDYTAFWGDHYDSPSFFVMAIYDYVTHTGDRSVLEEVIHGKTLLETLGVVLDKLTERADETGLLYKEGSFNKRDWADEVNRNGYVTYVEALYARALRSASRLFRESDPRRAEGYAALYEKVKDAINTLLFDEELGYYVNYKSSDHTEKNLSVDTVFTVLFGIADENWARSVLRAMERLLETRHNHEQKGGDFGVMCVYPLYGERTATAHKSMRPYDYHNGANWCYLTAMYAYAQYLYGGDWRYPLLSCFDYNVARGHYTLVEYFSPCAETGGPLQGWSGDLAFVYDQIGKENFFQ